MKRRRLPFREHDSSNQTIAIALVAAFVLVMALALALAPRRSTPIDGVDGRPGEVWVDSYTKKDGTHVRGTGDGGSV